MTNTDDETHILMLGGIIQAMLCSTVLTNLSIRSDSFLDTAVLSPFFLLPVSFEGELSALVITLLTKVCRFFI